MTPLPLSFSDLSPWRAQHPQGVLLDVRLAEDYAAGHVEGAVNNCVFEVAFSERWAALGAGRGVPVCCVGGGPGSGEALAAAEKLVRLGHTAVWYCAGPDGGVPAAGPVVPEGRHEADVAESWVEWTGRNLLNHHRGRVGVKSGWIEWRGGRLVGGEFVLDMNAITCLDLAGSPWHDVLVAHLKSDDFFDVDRFPEAMLRITGGDAVWTATAGAQNLVLGGWLTVRDVSRPVAFTASAGMTEDGRLAAQAGFDWDRTEWNVRYGSGRFFRSLAGHLVNDVVTVAVRVVTRPVSG